MPRTQEAADDQGPEEAPASQRRVRRVRKGTRLAKRVDPAPGMLAPEVEDAIAFGEDRKAASREVKANLAKSPLRIQAARRQRLALALRQGGMSLDDIAKSCGYSDRSAARKAIVRALEGLEQESAQELVAVNYERLNLLMSSIWNDALHGDMEKMREVRALIRDMNDLRGVSHVADMQVNITQQGTVILIGPDAPEQDYVDGMKELVSGVPGIPTVEFDDGIEEAEVVEDADDTTPEVHGAEEDLRLEPGSTDAEIGPGDARPNGSSPMQSKGVRRT